MHRAGERERLAEPAGTAGELSRRGAERKATIVRHPAEAGDGIESADQDAAGATRLFARDVHAVIAAVDGINIRIGGGTE